MSSNPTTDETRTSRIPGFYKQSVEERLAHVKRFANLSDADIEAIADFYASMDGLETLE